MTNNLLRFNKKLKYVVFDFETEGLNLRYSRPWQLGFIVVENGTVKSEHNLYLEIDNINISKGAAKTTGFDHVFYDKHKKDKNKILDFFDRYVYNPDYYLVGHNVLNYDTYIHNNLRLDCGKKTDYSYVERIIDTNCLSKAYKMNIKRPDDSLILWQYKLAGYRERNMKTNQKAMLNEFKIDFDESKLHDAIYDVKMTNELFKKLIWNIEI